MHVFTIGVVYKCFLLQQTESATCSLRFCHILDRGGGHVVDAPLFEVDVDEHEVCSAVWGSRVPPPWERRKPESWKTAI